MNWYKAAILSALFLIAFSVFHYYVISLPKLERARIEKEAQERAKKEEEDRAREAASETLAKESMEERGKAKRELEQAQAEHERQVGEHEAKEREKWEAPSDSAYLTTADISVYKSPMLSSEIVARIPKAMKVYVVGVRGDWLKIESKRGNPSGYIEKNTP